MYYGLYLSAAGAAAQGQKVEVLSNNLANVDTVGFKRELALVAARDSEAIERGLVQRGSRTLNDVGGGSEVAETATIFRRGNTRQTGNPTDLAIESENTFFVVKRGTEELLTRAGNFRLSSEGRLETQDGDSVLATDGSPIDIDPSLPWRFLPGGYLEQFGEVREVALRQATNLRQFTKAGSNLFSAPKGAASQISPEKRQVQVETLEMSGVNPMEEMVELVASQRTYETNVRMIQNHDQMTASLVNRMLKV